MRTQRRQFERARPAVLWTLLGFAAIQFALNAAVSQHPEAQDSEYAERLNTLRERMAEGPNRPLCLLIGSSRMVDNFAPEKLSPLPAVNGETPLVFNFAHLGAGPGMNLVVLRRLLREGIRPKWLVVEIMPPQLGDEKQSILYSTANIRDLSITRRLHHPFQVYGDFVRRDLAPCYKYRRLFASRVAPGWVSDAELEEDRVHLNPLGGWPKLLPPNPEQARLKTDKARVDYRPPLQQLSITDLSDRAMRELLRLCRHRGIAVVLILSPEGSEFRSWYSPEGLQRVEEYCRNLSRESGVPLIDARKWLADDKFIDSHHVNTVGAEHFTLRLNQEVLTPLVQGRLATPLSVATK